MKVLIAEDNQNDRNLLRTVLEHFGCEVTEAENGHEGLKAVLAESPDIIVSDALMPKMDGFQFLKTLKTDPLLCDIPFVFYSAVYTGAEEERLALALGASAFIVKPIEPEELWRQVSLSVEKAGSVDSAQPCGKGPIDESDEHFLSEYCRIVAAKLEEKVAELESALCSRQKAEERLLALNSELSAEIRERESTQQTLIEKDRELSTIFESAPYVMFLVDAAWEVKRVNALTCSLAGANERDVLDRPLGAAVRCLNVFDDPGGCGYGKKCPDCPLRNSIKDTLATGLGLHQIECTLNLGHGPEERGERTFLLSTSRISARNQHMVLVTLQDITEHKRLETSLYQAQKMESVGILAAGIAHDFNNILTIINGYTQVALLEMDKDDPQRKNLEPVLTAVGRAAHLVKDILLFSRKHPADKKVLDLNEAVLSVEKFLARIIGEDVVCSIKPCEEELFVIADVHQLEQVLLNFATNARDAMPGGGFFTITTAAAVIDQGFIAEKGFGRPGHYALISASDTGKGMGRETVGKIFDPFFTTKEQGKGTGLGLAVVYGIVKHHEGFVDVESEPGRGTVFSVYLPLADKGTVELLKNRETEEKPHGGTETILVAEDDDTVRKLTVMLLKRFGYRVIEAVDGWDAATKFENHCFDIDLILMDRIMPKMTGEEAVEEIRKINPKVKIIFLSGYAEDQGDGSKTGVESAGIMLKPFSAMELLATIRSFLDSDASAPPKTSSPPA